MESGVIVGILENRSGKKNSGTYGGAGSAGVYFEGATELGHAFAHAGDADAEARLAAMGGAVGRNDHAAAEVGDFEGDALRIFAEDDLGALAAGVALDVGEAFLGDAEERGFGNLGKAPKTGEEFEGSFDAVAFAEPVDVFLERGGEAEVVEQRWMEEVGEGADFAGHLLEKFAGLFERAVRGFVERLRGLPELGEAEIYGENGLGHAVVQFAADAAALFVL